MNNKIINQLNTLLKCPTTVMKDMGTSTFTDILNRDLMQWRNFTKRLSIDGIVYDTTMTFNFQPDISPQSQEQVLDHLSSICDEISQLDSENSANTMSRLIALRTNNVLYNSIGKPNQTAYYGRCGPTIIEMLNEINITKPTIQLLGAYTPYAIYLMKQLVQPFNGTISVVDIDTYAADKADVKSYQLDVTKDKLPGADISIGDNIIRHIINHTEVPANCYVIKENSLIPKRSLPMRVQCKDKVAEYQSTLVRDISTNINADHTLLFEFDLRSHKALESNGYNRQTCVEYSTIPNPHNIGSLETQISACVLYMK